MSKKATSGSISVTSYHQFDLLQDRVGISSGGTATIDAIDINICISSGASRCGKGHMEPLILFKYACFCGE